MTELEAVAWGALGALLMSAGVLVLAYRERRLAERLAAEAAENQRQAALLVRDIARAIVFLNLGQNETAARILREGVE